MPDQKAPAEFQKRLPSVIAIVAIRNGVYYLPRLCQHARENGYQLAIIDNDSKDNLLEITELNKDVIAYVENLPYDGCFDLLAQLEAKALLTKKVNADWVIHLDVDELLYSNVEGETLQQAFFRVQTEGHNAVNFDEFVFLPLERFKRYDSDNYHQMCWYYFFEPRPVRLVRAFKAELQIKPQSGGHNVQGEAKIYPTNFVMRHFMFENRSHVKKKYLTRTYSDSDIKSKFHGNRLVIRGQKLSLPSRSRLHKASPDDWLLDKTNPQTKHFWQWDN